MSISCKHGHLRRQCELCDAEQEIATLTARLEAQCKLREEREQDNDALTAKVAELEAVAAAADILAHDIPPGDNRAALDHWWWVRTHSNCTVCNPPTSGEKS